MDTAMSTIKATIKAAIIQALTPFASWVLHDELAHQRNLVEKVARRASTLQGERDALHRDMVNHTKFVNEMNTWARGPKCPEGARSAVLSWYGLLQWDHADYASRSTSMFGIVDPFARWGLER